MVDALKVIGIILLVAVVITAAVGWFVLAVWMIVWNVTDAQNVGVNFWNMFWIVVAGLMIFSPSSAVTLNN